MPIMVPFAQVIEADPTHSSLVILAAIAGLAFTVAFLFYFGLLEFIFKAAGRILRSAVNKGFALWRNTLAWANWFVFLVLVLSLITTGWYLVDTYPGLAILFGVVPLFMGIIACLAYLYLDLEQYEVERGRKAIHNPLKGQEPARDLARYGPQAGILLLAGAAVAMVGGFALLNQGLYWSIGRSWYQLEQGQATFADFLVYTLLNLYRIVDLLDLANHHRLVRLAHLQPVYWPATVLLAAFKTFFTFVLLEQVFAAVRKGKLLTETIADFFSPHQPIHERARHALPHYGVVALEPLLISLRAGFSLTKEQRQELPLILADIGPATVPVLLLYLKDPNEQVRAVAALALGHLHAVDALPDLAALQADDSEVVRLGLVEALGNIVSPGVHTVRKPQWLLLLVHGGPRRLRWWWRRRVTLKPITDPAALVIEQLRQALADPSPLVRTQAAETLGGLGRAAAGAVPDLLPLLEDVAETARCQSAMALKNIGADMPAVVEALIPLLDDPSPLVKAAAAETLGGCREQGAPAASALVALLQDREENVRQKAAEALGKVGPLNPQATAALLEGLADPDTLVRARTAEAIGHIGPAAEGMATALAAALQDDNDRVRAKAVEALGRIGEGAAEVALPQLVRALYDADTWVQALAAEALGEMGEEAADEAVPALIRSLSHANAQVRFYAAEALGNLGPPAASALPALEKAFQDEDAGVRAFAVRAFGAIGLSNRSQACLRQALHDADPQVRFAAVIACGAVGLLEKPTLQELLELLDDAHGPVKVEAARVVTKALGADPTLVTRLTKLVLEEDNAWVQEQIAAALGSLGPAAAAAGPALVQMALTEEAPVREAALRALVRIQPPEAGAAYIAGLRDEVANIRKVASAAWRVTAVPEEALTGLVQALHDPDAQVRANVALALSRLQAVPAAAIPLLIECANDPSDELRLNAALALQKTPGKEVQGIMTLLIQDPVPKVRLLAAGFLLTGDPHHANAQEVVSQALADESLPIRRASLGLVQTLGQAGLAWLTHLRARVDAETDEQLGADLRQTLIKLEVLSTVNPASPRMSNANPGDRQ